MDIAKARIIRRRLVELEECESVLYILEKVPHERIVLEGASGIIKYELDNDTREFLKAHYLYKRSKLIEAIEEL